MGRDLLYKPQVPILQQEEETDVKKTKKGKGSRELGRVGQDAVSKTLKAQQNKQVDKPQAHKNAYFNKDVSGVKNVNQNMSGLKALRGSKEATDLRKVVLPGSGMVDSPDPDNLRGAGELMGLNDGFNHDLAGLLGRQGAWAKQQGMTVEKLKERMEQLEAMVELRKAALGRMAEGKSQQPITSVTVLQAATSAGSALEQTDDVAGAGTDLIGQTQGQASGMHARIAKMFGIKLEQQ